MDEDNFYGQPDKPPTAPPSPTSPFRNSPPVPLGIPNRPQINAPGTSSEVSLLMAKIRRNTDKPTPPTPVSQAPDVPSHFLPTPIEGWPASIGRTSGHLLANINWVQLEQWASSSSPFVLISILGHGSYPSHISAEIADEAGKAIHDCIDAPNASVFAPIPETTPTRLFQPPYTYVVQDVSAETAEILLRQKVWNTPRVSFIALIANAGGLTHVGSIDGYNVKSSDTFRAANIRVFVKDTLYEHGSVGPMLADYLKDHPLYCDLSPADRTQDFLENLKLEPIIVHFPGKQFENSGRTIWNILLPQLTEDNEAWLEIIEAISQVNWVNPSFGPGESHKGWNCNFCHGTTHPTPLCRFPTVEGWYGVKRLTSVEDFQRVHNDHSWRAFTMKLDQLQTEIRRDRRQAVDAGSRGLPPRGRGRSRGLPNNFMRGAGRTSRGYRDAHA